MLYKVVSLCRPAHEAALSVCVYISPLPPAPPSSPPPSHHSRSSQSTELSSRWCEAGSCWLSISHTIVYKHQCYSLNLSHPPLLAPQELRPDPLTWEPRPHKLCRGIKRQQTKREQNNNKELETLKMH